MSQPKRYVVIYDGGFVAWEYREANDGDKSEAIWIKESDYSALASENERLRKAGDAFIGTYLFASVKGLVSQDIAAKVIQEWQAAKEGKEIK